MSFKSGNETEYYFNSDNSQNPKRDDKGILLMKQSHHNNPIFAFLIEVYWISTNQHRSELGNNNCK